MKIMIMGVVGNLCDDRLL